MPFPNLLRLALLVPFAAVVLAMIAPAFLSPIVPADFLKGAALVLVAAAGLVELFAVIVALFLLLRDGSYATPGNIVITLVASIPLAFVGFIAWVLKFGHFHI
jgi:hypothetical protein